MDVHAALPPVYNLNGFEIAVLTVIIILIIACVVWKWWTQFSDEELSELSDTMMYFHEKPNRDDFMQVWEERTRLIRHTGDSIKWWLWGVFLKHPEFYTDEQNMNLFRGFMKLNVGCGEHDAIRIWSALTIYGHFTLQPAISHIPT